MINFQNLLILENLNDDISIIDKYTALDYIYKKVDKSLKSDKKCTLQKRTLVIQL